MTTTLIWEVLFYLKLGSMLTPKKFKKNGQTFGNRKHHSVPASQNLVQRRHRVEVSTMRWHAAALITDKPSSYEEKAYKCQKLCTHQIIKKNHQSSEQKHFNRLNTEITKQSRMIHSQVTPATQSTNRKKIADNSQTIRQRRWPFEISEPYNQ